MKLFVGLGNPGAKYARNRHNIGFMAVERIAEDNGFQPWRGKFQGAMSQGSLGGEKVVLLKPETYMNLSGQAVGEAMRFFKLAPGDVTVFHDELDLAPGRVKLKTGGGHAGHNGLRSIHQHIGEAYARVRLGIGHPGHKDRVSAYVLSDFARADEAWLDDLLRGLSDGAPFLAAGDGAKFSNAVALRTGGKPTGGKAAEGKAAGGKAAEGKAAGRKTGGAKPASPPASPPGGQPRTDTVPARAASADEAAPAAEEVRSPLQKLMDKFR